MQKTLKKDWALVIVLVAVLLACLGRQIWIRPVREKIEKADTKIESLEEKRDALQSDQNSYRLSAARYQELTDQMNEAIRFLPSETTAAGIEQLVGGLLSDAGLTIHQMELTGPEVHSVPSLLEGADTQDSPIQTFSLTYSVSGTYDDLLQLCGKIRQEESLSVSALEFSVPNNENGTVDIAGVCEAELTITAYQVRRLVFTTEDVT